MNRLSFYQTLQTRSAVALEYFSIADKHFLTVANHFDGLTLQLDSAVYQWNGSRIVVVQIIPNKGAHHFRFFTIIEQNYVAIANYHDGSTYSSQ